MNGRQRESYWNEYRQLHKQSENQHIKLINAALQLQIKKFFEQVKTVGVNRATVDTKPIKKALRMIWRETSVKFGNHAYENVKRQIGQKRFGYNERWSKIILYYFDRYGGKKIQDISDTTYERIMMALGKGEAEGLSYSEIEKMMLGSQVTEARAGVIARTETNAAANFGMLIAANDLGIEVQKQWVTAKDERVRKAHMILDGDVVNIDGKFSNGMLFPSDPAGGPKEVINCRCVLAFVPVLDDNGNPIAANVGPKNGTQATGNVRLVTRLLIELGIAEFIDNLISTE